MNCLRNVLLLLLAFTLQAQMSLAATLEILSIPKQARPGDKVTVSVKSSPGAQLKIEVQGEVITQAFALKPIDADSSGKGSWTFEVNRLYKADKLPIVITASGKGSVEEKLVAAIPMTRRADHERVKLSLESEPKAVAPGQDVTVSVLTAPGTKCKIEAKDAGITQAMALMDKTADKDGKVSWTWKVGENFKADKMPVIITGKYKNGEKKLVTAIPINRQM